MICSALSCDMVTVTDDIDLASPAARLKWARVRAGYDSAAEFAEAARVNPTTYRAYENNQNGYAKLGASFAKLLGVSAEWLLEGGPTPDSRVPEKLEPRSTRIDLAPDRAVTRSTDAGEIAEIIRLDLSLPMGPGATVDDFVEGEPLSFDLAYVRSFTRTPPHRLRLAAGAGDSMFPTLVPNDLVWIDTTQNQLLHSDRIYAASINGGAAIKRLRPVAAGRRVMIISDNKTVDPYEVDASEVLIWGRVIRFARDL